MNSLILCKVLSDVVNLNESPVIDLSAGTASSDIVDMNISAVDLVLIAAFKVLAVCMTVVSGCRTCCDAVTVG